MLDAGGAGSKGDANMDNLGGAATVVPPTGGAAAEIGWLVDSETGNRHEVTTEIVIGREAPASVLYAIPTISKKHFAIRKQGAGFVIEDMHSTNGTYLNGLPVHDPVPLRDGDEIVVAITLKHPKGARIFHFSTKPA
ncbi:MAG: FHA domain-containing protein [Planctomycetes bacterium]|nr:FHA domain-containing protein [Planctomycetota bacterium]